MINFTVIRILLFIGLYVGGTEAVFHIHRPTLKAFNYILKQTIPV